MVKALLIAEKKIAAENIKGSYSKCSNPKYDITYLYAQGHLIELLKPDEYCDEWKKWEASTLPIIPKPFKEKLIENPSTKKLYYNIKKELDSGKYDIVINAGDAGREGEKIVDEILELAGNTLPEYRLWLSEYTDKKVIAAFNNLEDAKSPRIQCLKTSAKLRTWYDFLLGINGTRAIRISTTEDIVLGRVITAVLGLVVERDKIVENFKSQPFYEGIIEMISASGETFRGKVLSEPNNTRFDTKNEVADIIQGMGNIGNIYKVEKKLYKEEAPLLLDLTELQKIAFTELGMKATEVLDVAQSLYEKKLLSYPRTDSRYISQSIASQIKDNVKSLSCIPAYEDIVNDIITNDNILNSIKTKKYVDDAKLTDHHALLPTENTPDLTKLTKSELAIYFIVARQLLSIFMNPKVTEKTIILTEFGNAYVKSEGKITIDVGFRELYSDSTSDVILPQLSDGDSVKFVTYDIHEGETKAPGYYNEKSLLTAMQTAGKNIEDKDLEKALNNVEGLGTSATRADTIKKLINLEYLAYKGRGKSTKIISTPKGRHIVDLLDGQIILKADLSAKWEYDLKQVEEGKMSANQFYIDMLKFVSNITKELLAFSKTDHPIMGEEIICPLCQHKVITTPKSKYYYCEKRNKNKECTFIISKTWKNVTFKDKDVKTLCEGKKIKRTVTWDSGKKGQVYLYLDDNGYLKYQFPKTRTNKGDTN